MSFVTNYDSVNNILQIYATTASSYNYDLIVPLKKTWKKWAGEVLRFSAFVSYEDSGLSSGASVTFQTSWSQDLKSWVSGGIYTIQNTNNYVLATQDIDQTTLSYLQEFSSVSGGSVYLKFTVTGNATSSGGSVLSIKNAEVFPKLGTIGNMLVSGISGNYSGITVGSRRRSSYGCRINYASSFIDSDNQLNVQVNNLADRLVSVMSTPYVYDYTYATYTAPMSVYGPYTSMLTIKDSVGNSWNISVSDGQLVAISPISENSVLLNSVYIQDANGIYWQMLVDSSQIVFSSVVGTPIGNLFSSFRPLLLQDLNGNIWQVTVDTTGQPDLFQFTFQLRVMSVKPVGGSLINSLQTRWFNVSGGAVSYNGGSYKLLTSAGFYTLYDQYGIEAVNVFYDGGDFKFAVASFLLGIEPGYSADTSRSMINMQDSGNGYYSPTVPSVIKGEALNFELVGNSYQATVAYSSTGVNVLYLNGIPVSKDLYSFANNTISIPVLEFDTVGSYTVDYNTLIQYTGSFVTYSNYWVRRLKISDMIRGEMLLNKFAITEYANLDDTGVITLQYVSDGLVSDTSIVQWIGNSSTVFDNSNWKFIDAQHIQLNRSAINVNAVYTVEYNAFVKNIQKQGSRVIQIMYSDDGVNYCSPFVVPDDVVIDYHKYYKVIVTYSGIKNVNDVRMYSVGSIVDRRAM